MGQPAVALRRVVRSYLDHLTVERGLAVNTLTSYQRDLDRYLTTLTAAGVRDLGSVGSREVAGYVAALREGDADHQPLSAASTARAASAVRGLHRFAVREGLVNADVAREVRPPNLPRRLPKALDLDQVERLLAAVGQDPAGGTPAAGGAGDGMRAVDIGRALRDRALLEFLYGTGARISEAVGCAVDDLDLDEGTVLLRGKGDRMRLVPIGGYACRALQAYLVRGRPALVAGGRGTPAVFVNARGGRAVPAERLDDPAPGRRARRPARGRRAGHLSRTRCVTRTPLTCSTAARTSGWCRNCSATPR